MVKVLLPNHLVLHVILSLWWFDQIELQVRGTREAMTIQDWAAQRCTISYRAPELFNVESHCVIDERTDIWVKLYFLWRPYLPFGILSEITCKVLWIFLSYFSLVLRSSCTLLVAWLRALLHDDAGGAIWPGISKGGQCCPGCPESCSHPTALQVSLQTLSVLI